MSRSPAMSGKAMAMKSLKEKWLSRVQLARENGENGIGGGSIVTITSKYIPWKIGEKVWLETTNLHMNGPKKLQMKRTSPFEIEQVISRTAF